MAEGDRQGTTEEGEIGTPAAIDRGIDRHGFAVIRFVDSTSATKLLVCHSPVLLR